MRVDYLVVGAGLYGSVFARQLADAGKSVHVVDSREHIGGNCYTKELDHIQLHIYGPHIFHTNHAGIWKYVCGFTDMLPYRHHVRAHTGKATYSFPISLDVLGRLMGLHTPHQARAYLELAKRKNVDTETAEGWLLSTIGPFLYEKFYKGYTEKQWGREASEVPAEVVKRVPVRLTYNTRYFNDHYEGIPAGGYTQLFERVLAGIPVSLETPFPDCLADFQPNHIIYSGPIDTYFDCHYGPLGYRSLRFDHEKRHTEDYQGCSQMNFPERNVEYTRIIEHKHFQWTNTPWTYITKEFPMDKGDPYYPIPTEENKQLYRQYRDLAVKEKHVTFGGRLGSYQYLNMDQVIASALLDAERLLT